MTERAPMMPAPFHGIPSSAAVLPNPRTVRATDMTWFNTCGEKIIKTDYNKCTGDIRSHEYPWGRTADPRNVPFNLRPWGGNTVGSGQCSLFQRFNTYGLASKCGCALNRCGCSDPRRDRCPLYGGSYVNPN